MWVEPTTGTALEANQRLAFNFFIERDPLLLTNIKETQPWLLPYTFVRREFKMSPKQIGTLLGDLQDAMKIKLASQIVGYILGFILLGVAGFMFYKHHRIYKENSLEDFNADEETSNALDNKLNNSQKLLINRSEYSNSNQST